MRRTLFPVLAMTGALVIGLTSPAYAADVGVLSLAVPATMTSNVEFQVTINYKNNTGATITDPDAIMYISATNGSGTLLPLPLANVDVRLAWDGAPADAISKWDTGAGNQVGVRIYPNVHTNMLNGWNANYILKVKVLLPVGAAKLRVTARVYKSGTGTIYGTKSKEVAVITPPAPSPSPVRPTPRPRPTPTPRASSVAPSAVPSLSTSEAVPSPSEALPSATEAAAAPEPSEGGGTAKERSGMPLGVWWIGGLLILVGLALLVWLIVRNRSRSDEEI